MKKIVLLLFVLVGWAATAFGQVNADFLGYWTSDQTSVGMVFYQDSKNDVRLIAWDRTDGEVLEISNLMVAANVITCNMLTKSTNWSIASEYRVVDANTIEEIITNNSGVKTITFFRTK